MLYTLDIDILILVSILDLIPHFSRHVLVQLPSFHRLVSKHMIESYTRNCRFPCTKVNQILME